MRSAVFISVRNKARRLPEKVLRDLKGRRVIEHIIDRVRQAKRPDLYVVATSAHPDDRILVELARAEGIEAFQGSEDDKLKRYLDAAREFDVEFATIVDGDDVFCDPTCIDMIIAEYAQRGGDYIIVDHLPVGVTAFGVRIEALARVVGQKKERDTEVWGQYFANDPSFVSKFLEPPPKWRHPDWRMTLDYPEDLAFFQAVYDELHEPGKVFSFDAIADLLDGRPDIVALNAGAQEKYSASIRAQIEKQAGTHA